jgi:hypothetical protein
MTGKGYKSYFFSKGGEIPRQRWRDSPSKVERFPVKVERFPVKVERFPVKYEV